MDALEMSLLFDYYGGMLTDKQRECFDMRHNQDLSLGEIAQALGVSRQAVCDNLTRTEALLRRMEENVGCVSRDLRCRKAMEKISDLAQTMLNSDMKDMRSAAEQILSLTETLEE